MAGLAYSDTSTRQGLLQDCEDNLNFPAAGITGTTALLQQFTRLINTWYSKVVTMILASQDGWDWDDSSLLTNNPIATRALVAGQRDYKFSNPLWALVNAESIAGNPTVTIASPGVFTLVAHGLNIGQPVSFTTTGALPTGLTAGTTYYVIAAGFTADTFEVSATIGGSAVNTTGSQSGTHSLFRGLGILRIKRVDIALDGTNYYKAEMIDTGQIGTGLGNDTNTDAQFSKTKPYYDVSNNGISVYPAALTADVTSGAKMRIEFTRMDVEFVTGDTTKQPGFDVPFHRMLSIGASYDYALIKNLPTQSGLQALLQDYEMRLKQYYGLKDTDTQFIMKSAYISYN